MGVRRYEVSCLSRSLSSFVSNSTVTPKDCFLTLRDGTGKGIESCPSSSHCLKRFSIHFRLVSPLGPRERTHPGSLHSRVSSLPTCPVGPPLWTPLNTSGYLESYRNLVSCYKNTSPPRAFTLSLLLLERLKGLRVTPHSLVLLGYMEFPRSLKQLSLDPVRQVPCTCLSRH